MTKRYLGNIITQNPTAPAGNLQGSAAKGVWSLEEQLAYQKAGLWPVPGNFVDIPDVFSTYLYEGTSAAHTITNGIDLAGEGGLVLLKDRDNSGNHALFDTERGAGVLLQSSVNLGQYSGGTDLSAFNSNGFSLGSTSFIALNTSGTNYASWTFRKAPKFFDCITWTGDGTNNRTLSHNLGCEVGFIAIKRYNGTGNWRNYHRSLGYDYEGYLNTTDQFYSGSTAFGSQNATSTNFYVGSSNNDSGHEYVAYLFAHNDGDGEFGPDGSDIIKCGSYTGNGSTDGPEIDLGFEPQWIMTKAASISGEDWRIHDVMRGFNNGSAEKTLVANTSAAEGDTNLGHPTATGFKIDSNDHSYNKANETYIFMAIRRGPLAQPESATEVFAVQAQAGGYQVNRFASSGFPVDFVLDKEYDDPSNWLAYDRLRGGKADLKTNLTNAESTNSPAPIGFDYNDGITEGFYNSANNVILPMWKRAPGYFDVVAYTGNGTAGRTVSHNLGVAPEMMWIKKRSGSYEWIVYSPAGDGYLRLNTDEVYATSNVLWNATSPTATEFTLGGFTHVNGSGEDYIAYLFASLPGISKVGSYTGTGATLNIDCGFTSGARFVLLKRTDSIGEWRVFDTARGIVAGNDPLLNLNSTNAEEAFDDLIDPYSAGFTLTSSGMVNVSGGSYIFYAIA